MLGSALLRFLIENGKGNAHLWVDSYEVSVIRRCNQISRSELVQNPIPDEISHLIHLAGVPSQSQADLFERKWQVYEENSIYTFRLIENFFRQAVERNVFIGSTGAVYGDAIDCDDGRGIALSTERPHNSYGNSKLFSELALHLSRSSKHRIVIGRIFHTFSPWFKSTDPRALQNILRSAVSQNKITINTPEFTRGYLHYADFCQAIRYLFDTSHSFGCTNIGSDKNVYSLAELADLVQQRFEIICKKSCPIYVDQGASKKNLTLNKVPVLDRLKSLGWEEKENISAAIDVFLKNWKNKK